MRRLFIALFLLTGPAFAGAACAQESTLIAVLRSDAPVKEKADACRELARVGTQQAVPALAPLLTDERLSLWARYALEPIADPSVDAALREALVKTNGTLRVGIISSLGVRRDPRSIRSLARCLTDADPTVAQAAARALGSIGRAAAPVLRKALSGGSPANRFAVGEGLLRCADSMEGSEATAIYDRIRAQPNLPEHVRVAALLSAIRSRGAQGLPLLLETIRTGSDEGAAGAMQLSMGMKSAAVTRVLAGELAHVSPGKQLVLVQALGNRGDSTAAPALQRMARSGSAELRVAAIRGLTQLGSTSSLAVLVSLVRDPDASVSEAARTALIGFPGAKAEATVLAGLNDPDKTTRIAMIDVACQRRITTAVPALLKAATEADSSVSGASFRALGELASVADIPAMVDAMVRTPNVAAAETALSAVCSGQPDTAVCADKLVPGLAKAQDESKLALLRVLGAVAGPQALAAVRAAAADADEVVRDTALRVLCDWPATDALPDLAQIAKTTPDTKVRILALRGELRLIPAQAVPDAQKLSQLKELLPSLERKEEQVLALAALSQIPSAESLALVTPYLANGAVQEEASLAGVAISERIVADHPVEVAEAMEQVQTSNAEVAARVRQLLAKVPEGARDQGFTSIFNGKDLSGWDSKPGWWTVEDGALTAESTPEKPCKTWNYLIWRGGQPADFELRADFKLSVSANSGIQIRSEERPDWDTFGYQADMTGDGELVGFVYHHSRGLIAGRGERAVFDAEGKKTVEAIGDPAELLKHFNKGGWNTYRVICRGPSITLYVNGVLMCQITDHHATLAAKSGIIALQMHPGPPMKIQFKNIRLKELK